MLYYITLRLSYLIIYYVALHYGVTIQYNIYERDTMSNKVTEK